MQAIFGCRMLEAIYNEQYLINVDEASYSKSVKTANSWLPCGKSNPIMNSRFQGSANIIFTLWVYGEWMWLISNETTTAIKFVRFTLLLRKFIEFVIWVDPTTIRVWLDNAPLHSSRIMKRAAHNLEMSLPLSLFTLTGTCWVDFWNVKENSIKRRVAAGCQLF